MDIINVITNVGFPIACCMVMAYYVKDNQKENRSRFDELNNRFIELQKDTITAIQNNTSAIEDLHEIILCRNTESVHERR